MSHEYLIYLEQFLIKNNHRVTLTMSADKDLSGKEAESEHKRLSEIKHRLNTQDIKNIKDKVKKLEELQEMQELTDLEVLPKVSIEDVSKKARVIELIDENVDDIKVYRHTSFTNQIVYADLHFDLPKISFEELPYLRLFSGFISEVGVGGRDYKKNLEYMQRYTGGLGAFVSLHVDASNYNKCLPTFGIRGKALYRNSSKLFSLIGDTIQSVNFGDKSRVKELLSQHHSSLEHHITQNALKYATNLSSKHFSLPAAIGNSVYGLHYLLSLREIVKEFDKNPNKLIDKFFDFKSRMLATKNARLVLSLCNNHYQHLKQESFYGLTSLCKNAQGPSFNMSFNESLGINEARVAASPVAFTAMSLPTVSFNHKDAAYLNIAAHLFENKILHKRIREQGGAYGAGASPHFLSGHFTFYAYRDPHLANTYKAFLEAIETISDGKFLDKEIEEAKLQIMQDLDAPITPGNRASTAFSWLLANKTYEVRLAYRKNLLEASKQEIILATKNHIQKHLKDLSLVSFANRAFLEKEALLLKNHGINHLPIKTV